MDPFRNIFRVNVIFMSLFHERQSSNCGCVAFKFRFVIDALNISSGIVPMLLMINQHFCGAWFLYAASRYTWTNIGHSRWSHIASLGHNELISISIWLWRLRLRLYSKWNDKIYRSMDMNAYECNICFHRTESDIGLNVQGLEFYEVSSYNV